MNYPIAIEHEPGKPYGIQVPDLPGSFSVGDNMDEAVAFHIEGVNRERFNP